MPQNPLIASYEPLDSSNTGNTSPLIAKYEPLGAPQQPILGGKSWDTTHPTQSAEPSFLERMGGWRGLAGAGVRLGAGLLGSEGMAPGAAINALGETVAEGVEGSDISPTRIATEAALGAVPFHSLMPAGRIGAAALRSGLYGAVGTGARELAAGQPLDPQAIATTGGISAATGGILSKFFGVPKTSMPEAPPPERPVWEPTSRQGPGTRTLGRTTKGGGWTEKGSTPTEVRQESQFPPYTPIPDPESVQSRRTFGTMAPEGQPPMEPQDFTSGLDASGKPYNDPYALASARVQKVRSQEIANEVRAARAAASSGTAKANTGEIMRDQRNLADVMKWREAQDKAKLAAQQIADAKAGLIETPGTPRQTVKAPTAAGSESMTTTWQQPEEGAVTPGDLSPEESALAKALRPTANPARLQRTRPTIPPNFVPPGLGPDVPAFPATTAPEVPAPGAKPPVSNIPTREPQVVPPTSEPVMQQPATPEGVTPDSIARAKAARDAELEAYGAPIAKANDEAIAQQSRANFQAVPGGKLGASAISADPSGEAVEQSSLAKFFKTPVDAVGSAYRAAKSESGVNPLARQQLGVSLQKEAIAAGLPTKGSGDLAKFLETKIAPEISADTRKPTPLDIAPPVTPEVRPTIPEDIMPEEGAPNLQHLKDEVQARYAGTQENPGSAPIPQYNIEGGPSAGSTVSAETLGKQGIPVPPGAAPDVSGSSFYDQPIEQRTQKLDELNRLLRGQGPGLPPKSVGAAAASDPNIGPAWYDVPAKAKQAVKAQAPGLKSRIAYGALGAALGTPFGATLNPDDPSMGALEGAIGGGIAGYAGRSGFQEAAAKGTPGGVGAMRELVNYRNSGLLAGVAQVKKLLSDAGTYIGTAAEKAASGDTETAVKMFKEAIKGRQLARDYAEGWKNPELARQVLGESSLSNEPVPTGALGWVTKPFAAAQNMTSKAMQRAGVPLSEANAAMMVNDPTTALGKWWLAKQSLPGMGGQIARALAPFGRISTNIVEGGLERTPGIGQFMGDPKTAMGRQIMGGGAMVAGAIKGSSDQAAADAGDPSSNLSKGLWRAGMARYGIPFALGEAIGGSDAKEIYNLIPGLRANVEPPAPGDTLFDWARKLGAGALDQFIPAIFGQAASAKNVNPNLR